jgi:hypothetical protein
VARRIPATVPAGAPRTPEEVVRFFDGWGLEADVQAYIAYHRRRYALLLDVVGEALALRPSPRPVLADVAPLFQTTLLRALVPHGVVHTVGFGAPPGGWGPGTPDAVNVVFDLNDAYHRDRWPDLPEPVDLVVMGEVIEHLYTAPEQVLACVAHWLAPGAAVVVQTPNAIALRKRLRLLAGRMPYDRIHHDRREARHFRELTLAELHEAAAAAGLRPERVVVGNYFAPPGRRAAVLDRLSDRLLPASLREGLTVRYRADASRTLP